MADDYHNKEAAPEPLVFIHAPPNEQPFKALYAFLSIDEQGNEGIMAIPMATGLTALVFGHARMIEKVRPLVVALVKATGRKVRLVRYQTKSVLEEFEP